MPSITLEGPAREEAAKPARRPALPRLRPERWRKFLSYYRPHIGLLIADLACAVLNGRDSGFQWLTRHPAPDSAEPMDRAATFDVFAGTFQVNYPKDEAPAYVALAQTYLDSLTGNDAIYYENPELKGRELVRLQGIENAEGVVAQSQYALRYINGGAPGIGPFASALGTSGAGGLGGIGAGGIGAGLGAGEAAGGGGPLLTTGGFGGTPSTTTTPGGGPPTSTTTRVPAGGPGTSTVTITTHGGGGGTPVPAPTGIVLGLVALGTLATRRIYTRLVQK